MVLFDEDLLLSKGMRISLGTLYSHSSAENGKERLFRENVIFLKKEE